MNTSVFQSHPLTRREKLFGTAYFLFETLFLAAIVQWLNWQLPSPLPQSEVNFLFFAVNFTAAVLIFRRFLVGQCRLVRDCAWQILYVTVPGFVVYYLMNFLLIQVIFALDPDFYSINDVTIQELVAENFFLMFLGTVILVPITEETLFRGLVFRGLHERSPILAWVVSVCLFSLVHITGYIGAYPPAKLLLCFLQYIPAGICLAGAYRLSGSLLAPILIHAMVNFQGMIYLR